MREPTIETGEPPRLHPQDLAVRRLAAAVLHQACLDVHSPTLEPAVREGARAFLQGGEMLAFWCECADVSPESLSAWVRRKRAA